MPPRVWPLGQNTGGTKICQIQCAKKVLSTDIGLPSKFPHRLSGFCLSLP